MKGFNSYATWYSIKSSSGASLLLADDASGPVRTRSFQRALHKAVLPAGPVASSNDDRVAGRTSHLLLQAEGAPGTSSTSSLCLRFGVESYFFRDHLILLQCK